MSAGGTAAERGLDPGRAALWALFAALVLGGLWLSLRACALDALGLGFCPAPVDHRALDEAVAAGIDLTRQVHEAQLRIAEKPLCQAPPVPPTFPAAAPPPATQRPPESIAIDKKVEERGGKNGKLQFTLEWATRDDLDIAVECPGGRIDSRDHREGPGICGDGKKDIDANRNLIENVSDTPVENVVWQDAIPAGRYTVLVIEAKPVSPDGNTVPFKLRIRDGDREKSCSGSVTVFATSDRRQQGGETITGTGQSIVFTPGGPLPDCTFTPINLVAASQK